MRYHFYRLFILFFFLFFFFNDTATTEIYTLSLHDALPVNNRADVKNHSLSFAIGPPSVALVSSSRPILSTNLTPLAARKGERLSLCIELFSKPWKTEPLKRLPPSFGIMLIFTPPV